MRVKSENEVAQSCLTLRDPLDCSPPGSSIHGIFQARVLEWGAIAFSQKCSEVTFIKVLIVYHNHGLLLGLLRIRLQLLLNFIFPIVDTARGITGA